MTDADSRAALAVTRALGAAGHHVVAAERTSSSLAGASRFCAASVAYPDPRQGDEAFVQALLAAVRAHRVDVLLPVADVTTMLVAEHRSRFEALCALPIPSTCTLLRAADKADVVRTAERLGVPVPRTAFLERRERAAEAAAAIGYPVVVKPRRSRVRTDAGWQATSVGYASNPAALRRLVDRCPDGGFPILVQERIEGPGVGVFMCYSGGVPIAEFGHRRLREKPPTGGVSVLSESIALPPSIRAHARSLLDALGWTGVAMVEFKVDARDGEPKLMEINGRFWGSLQLAVDSGVDFPSILLSTLNGAPSGPPPAYEIGIRNRWLWGDFDSLLLTLRSGDAAARFRAVAEFMKLWRTGLHYENPRLGDLKPWFRETRQRIAALGGGGAH